MWNPFKSKTKSHKFGDDTLASSLRAAGAPIDFWQRDLGFGETYANNIVSICETIIANSIAQLSIHHMKDGKRQKGSRVEKLLRKPNPMTNGQNFMQSLVRSTLEDGTGYAMLKRSANFQAESLWNATTSMPLINQDEEFAIYGTVSVPVTQTTYQDIPGRLMAAVRFKTSTRDPYGQLTYSDDVQQLIDLFNTMILNMSGYFEGTDEFAGYLSTSMTLTPEQTKALRDRLQELSKQGATPILTNALEYKSIPKDNQHLQYIEILGELKKSIAAAYGVPLPLINEFQGNSTYKSSEELIRNFYNVQLNPYLDVIKIELEETLLLDGFNECLEFDLSAYSDQPSMMEKYQSVSMIDPSILTVDEKRSILGFEALGIEK